MSAKEVGQTGKDAHKRMLETIHNFFSEDGEPFDLDEHGYPDLDRLDLAMELHWGFFNLFYDPIQDMIGKILVNPPELPEDYQEAGVLEEALASALLMMTKRLEELASYLQVQAADKAETYYVKAPAAAGEGVQHV
jgi:hypothetical protein